MECTEISSWLSALSDSPPAFDLQLFAGEKTEEPTAKRKADTRKKGQIPKSQEMNTVFVLFTGFWVLSVFGKSVYEEICAYTIHILSNIGDLDKSLGTEAVMELFLSMILVLAKTALPFMVSILFIGLVVNLMQVGINFTTEPFGINLDKLNPINGFGRIFSKNSLVELVKSLLKIAIIGSFIYHYLKGQIMQMPELLYLELSASLSNVADVIFRLAFQVCGVIFILAVLDLWYQRWHHNESIKMSKDEVKEEFKQMEGNPQIKAKIRQKQREMAMSRMMREVPKADVIITNPTHFAVALRYEKGMHAPEVVAKGQDYVALKIKEVAREAGVMIVENKPLARALYAAVDIGGIVPPELYKSVAEVLAYVYRLKHRRYA